MRLSPHPALPLSVELGFALMTGAAQRPQVIEPVDIHRPLEPAYRPDMIECSRVSRDFLPTELTGIRVSFYVNDY
jgi:hypothetical protein